MRVSLKLTAFLASVLLLVGMCFVGCSNDDTESNVANLCEPFEAEISYLPMTSEGVLQLSYNPERGFRSGCILKVGDIAESGSYSEIKQKVYSILSMYVFNLDETSKVINIGYNLSKYHEMDKLPEEAVNVFKATSEILQIKKLKQNINFLYNGEYYTSWGVSEEAKANIASVCASQDIMLSHIDQLAALVSEYKDTVSSIMGGFIGFSGDMVDSSQYPPVDRNTIMKAVIEKLVVPNNVYYLIRLPEHKYELAKDYPDYEYLDRISFVNKAMFGEQTKAGWNSGGYQKGNPEGNKVDWWEYVTLQAAYAPNDGELFPNSNLIGKQLYPTPRIPTGIEIILECAHHCMTTMGFWNGYYEVGSATDGPAVMDLWHEEIITKDILEENNIVYDPAWFLDNEGNTVTHNSYEFIRDHLGYKLVAINADVRCDSKEITVDMNLKNYGFSAAFNLESGFAILDENYNIISETVAGEPNKWYSRDPFEPSSTEALEHSVQGKLAAPTASGKYYVAFYLKNTMDDFAMLSNRELGFEKGYNILYEFENK